uniref:Uncharacterized protein n=1 Tax=Oryza brachyantha TaxID=4533 RepID=J3LHF6_ORYBR
MVNSLEAYSSQDLSVARFTFSISWSANVCSSNSLSLYIRRSRSSSFLPKLCDTLSLDGVALLDIRDKPLEWFRTSGDTSECDILEVFGVFSAGATARSSPSSLVFSVSSQCVTDLLSISLSALPAAPTIKGERGAGSGKIPVNDQLCRLHNGVRDAHGAFSCSI